jgi:PadR family transcriptional regulator, regulatory protein PadR
MTQGETILLGLLYQRNFHGYELEKIIDENQMRQWTEIGFSSIYSILNKLAKQKLIAYRYEKEYGAPKRKVYYILDLGRDAVRTEITRMLVAPKSVYPDFNVGLVLSGLLTDEEFRAALRDYKENLLAQRAMYEQKFAETTRKKKSVALLCERITTLFDAEIAWIDKQLTTA